MARSIRTKALAISRITKEAVHKRQKGRSLFAPYQPITIEECCCHFIPRSKGGLGIEENIFGCSQEQHRLFDGNILISPGRSEAIQRQREKMKAEVIAHLKQSYEDWNEEDLIYKKHGGNTCY